jgi:hypothetical protein
LAIPLLARSALVFATFWLFAQQGAAQEAVVEPEEGYPSEVRPPPEPEPSEFYVRQWRGLRLYLNFNAMTGMPFEQARANGGGWAWGFGFAVGFSWDDWPITVGLDLYGTHFGTLRGSQEYVENGMRQHESLRLRDQVYFFDSWLRLQPARWKARPYLEGVVGIKAVSHLLIVDALIADDDNSSQSANQSASTLGVGGGIDLTLGEKGSTRAYLSLGVRWLRGGKVGFDKTVFHGGEVSTMPARYATTTTCFFFGVSVDVDLFAPDTLSVDRD